MPSLGLRPRLRILLDGLQARQKTLSKILRNLIQICSGGHLQEQAIKYHLQYSLPGKSDLNSRNCDFLIAFLCCPQPIMADT